MDYTSIEIRLLRQRLGWSLAEMARRMGCTCDLITAWETGASRPDPEAHGQLHTLGHHVDWNSERVQQSPVAEVHMEIHGLGQLTGRDLL